MKSVCKLFFVYLLGIFLCGVCSIIPILAAGKKKNIKPQKKNKEDIVSFLAQDITHIKDLSLPSYNVMSFFHNGDFALIAHEDNMLRIWRTKDAKEIRKILMPEGETAKHIYIAPNDKSALLVTVVNISSNTRIRLVDLSTLSIQYVRSLPSSIDVVFEEEGQYFFNLQKNNVIEKLATPTGKTLAHYAIPEYDEKNLYYTRIKKIIYSSLIKNGVLLLDVGHAEELSSQKIGLHINIIPFYFQDKQILEPIAFYKSLNRTVTPEDFGAVKLSPNGEHLFMGIKNKLLYYNIRRKTKKEFPIMEAPNVLRFDASGKFLLASGPGTTLLWEMIDSVNICRLLRRMVTKARNVTFTAEAKYLIGTAKTYNRFVIFNMESVTRIRLEPSLFVRYAAQKHTKMDMIKWINQLRKKNKRDYKINTQVDHDDKVIASFFNKNLQYYAREVFNIASDYFYTDKELSEGEDRMYLYTNGFFPLEVEVTERDFKRKQDAFVKGQYHWSNVKLGLTAQKLYLISAEIQIGGYPYYYKEENNKNRVTQPLVPRFTDFDMNEKIVIP